MEIRVPTNVPNPLDLIDTAALKAVSTLTRTLYRSFGIHPLAVQKAPAVLFVALGAWLVMLPGDIAERGGFAAFLAIFSGLVLPSLRRDLPAIRRQWNIDDYRHHQARALARRSQIGLRHGALLLALVSATLIVLQSTDPLNDSIAIVMVAVIQTGYYCDAMDLPEPHEGDVSKGFAVS